MTRPYDIRVEPENLSAWKITVVLGVSIAVILLSAFVVKEWLPLNTTGSSGGLTGAPSKVGPLEVVLLPGARGGLRAREEQRQELQRYSWVDRDRGVVAIPIERAMELVAGEQR